MTANPNPARIPDSLWWLWEQEQAGIPGARLGGIYADKSCYHNTVAANLARWPDAYCIRLPLDLDAGPRDKARAIDTTLSEAEMILRTGYLKRAAEHPTDRRLYALREFIGTLDGQRVFCMIRETDSGPWRVDWSRDASHLWHIHKSFWTTHCADMAAAAAVASVMLGQTWEQWRAQQGEDMVYRIIIASSDPAWNGKMVIGWAGGRFTARQPGAIRTRLRALYPNEQTWTDEIRGTSSWPSFLDGVFGPDVAGSAAATAATLEQILAAALDDSNVQIDMSAEAIAAVQAVVADLKAELRDAVADLGEGGAAAVRADA